MSDFSLAPNERAGMSLRLPSPPDPRLLATLNRFHFRRLFLSVAEPGGTDPGQASPLPPPHDPAWVQGRLRAIWECYAPFLEGEGWLPNKTMAQGGQGDQPKADLLAEELEAGLCHGLGIDPPPAAGRFALAFTHDVDVVGSWPLATFKSGLVFAMNALRGLGSAEVSWFFTRLAARFLLGRVDYYGFGRIMALARRLDFRPVFFLYAHLPGHNKLSRWQRLAGLNPNYDLDDPDMARALAEMRATRAQVGLHGSFLSAQDPRLLGEEKQRLERASGLPCLASRQHFLHLRRETTLAGARACGMEVDSTCGYVYDNGLFCGTVRPFYALAPTPGDPGLVVAPMIFMDAVPLYFRPAAPSQVRQHLEAMVEMVRARGGLAAINFHQRMISCVPEYHDLYEELVGRVRAAGGRPAALDELDQLYPALDEIRIVA